MEVGSECERFLIDFDWKQPLFLPSAANPSQVLTWTLIYLFRISFTFNRIIITTIIITNVIKTSVSASQQILRKSVQRQMHTMNDLIEIMQTKLSVRNE